MRIRTLVIVPVLTYSLILIGCGDDDTNTIMQPDAGNESGGKVTRVLDGDSGLDSGQFENKGGTDRGESGADSTTEGDGGNVDGAVEGGANSAIDVINDEDNDSDGYFTNEDCDDNDADQHPGADEVCNGEDDDCDGSTDEPNAIDISTWYLDKDSDTFGDPDSARTSCRQPEGYVADDTDCDDSDANQYPGADELCNGEDDDCDGETDEDDAIDVTTWYADGDSDEYGNPNETFVSCNQPTGFVADNTDCDDDEVATNPERDEYCNDGVDDDCDGQTDEGDAVDAQLWYADEDSDGYGDPDDSLTACAQPAGYVADNSDCDDNNGDFHPGVEEKCDGFDTDCDGFTDGTGRIEIGAVGYIPAKDATSGWVRFYATVSGADDIHDLNVLLNIKHTNDADLDVFLTSPRGTEVELFTDVGDTGDNFTETLLDDEATVPITDGTAPFTGSFQPEGMLIAFDGENPNGTWSLEITDDRLNDSGVLDKWLLFVNDDVPEGAATWYRDTDGDGYGNGTQTVNSCTQPAHYVADNTDCDDGNGDIYPEAPRQCDNYDTDCDGESDDLWGTTGPIPDKATSEFYVEVGGLDSILDVNVRLNITHSFVSDLVVHLISPEGTSVELFSIIGGSGDNFVNTILDDEASVLISDGWAPFTGSYEPEGALWHFDGENPNGTWILEIADESVDDEGNLDSWSLIIDDGNQCD